MKQLKFGFLLLVVLFALAACGGSDSLNITQTILAKSEDDTRSTSVFAPGDTMYLLVDLSAPENTRVKATWTAVNAEGAEPNYLIDEIEQTFSGTGRITFDLTNDSQWPTGEYKVDLSVNDEAYQSLPFRVQAPIGQTGDTATGDATAEPQPTEETAAAGPVNSLESVKSATIQIEAEGSFVDPEVGLMLNAAGRGSGVIIDPSGIAVTNNHVVTGAALLQVWVGGESEPRNARILGVSECSDLAVIDIEGEGYPYAAWYEGDVGVGLDVYAAGFPLGDPEFTLTRGIVSKASADGETSWASVDAVIEHDATINPGNSGGPLVTADGQLVGINYAGSSDTNQYFAIARAEARPLIEQLRAGQDVTSIGVNGSAVSDGESLTGIWVSSVKSGSPADQAGVRGGDIITTLEGLVLATDGTMSDYCDILRTHDADDPMNIEVLRFSTQEVLAGQLNGREMVTTFSFAQTLEDEVPDAAASGGASGPAYTSYTTISDDSGTLLVEVPSEWSDVLGTPYVVDGTELGPSVSAAPDLNAYSTTWTMPGVTVTASEDLATSVTEEELLDLIDFSDSCTYEGRESYEDALYQGFYDVWSGCGGTNTTYVVVATAPPTREFTVLLEVQVVSDADLEALDHILNSFVVLTE